MAHRREYDILKQPIPTLLVTVGALFLLLTSRAIRSPYATEQGEGILSPVGVWIDSLLGPYVGVVVVAGAIISASLILTRVINRYSLSVIRSFMPMVLFMVCVLGVVYPISSPSIMLSLLMLTEATELMFLSFKRQERFSQVMRGAFWTALAALIVPQISYLLILLPVQWVIWQRSTREMFAGALMVPLPMLLGSCLFWFGGQPFGWLLDEWYNCFAPLKVVNIAELYACSGGILNCALWGVVMLITLWSILVFVGNYHSMRTRARKGHILFSLFFLLEMMMFFLFNCHTMVIVPLMGLSAVPLIHTLFVKRKDILSMVIYFVLIGLTALSALA